MPQLYLCDSGSGQKDDGTFATRGRLIERRYAPKFAEYVDAYLENVDQLHSEMQKAFEAGLKSLRDAFHTRHQGAKLPDTNYADE